jgi:DNA-directed RNA polymerase subunit E'/Rpb7
MTLITRRVVLDAKYLNQNLMYHLLQKIRDITKNECSKLNGYILNINKLSQIIDNSISSANSDIVFTVEFDADTLKPEVGNVLTGMVCMMCENGVFLDIHEGFKVLIPVNGLNGFIMNENEKNEEEKYFTRNENEEIVMGDELKVEISGVKYSKQLFHVYGKLIED